MLKCLLVDDILKIGEERDDVRETGDETEMTGVGHEHNNNKTKHSSRNVVTQIDLNIRFSVVGHSTFAST